MRSLKKTRRIQIIGLSFAALAAVLVLLWFLPDDAFQFFYSPTEISQSPPTQNQLIRVGGLVEMGSLVRGEGTEIAFNVTDGASVVPVVYEGILPDLFGEGEGMVAQGRYVNGTFEAVEILARHDETYMPKEVIDALKEQGVYVDPNGG